jgi:hypothetical protein
MTPDAPLLTSQIIVRICLFLVAAIAISAGALQMYLGQPDTDARLDDVHRFMAGVYLSTGIICFWAAVTIRQHGFLVYLLALGCFFWKREARVDQQNRATHPSPSGSPIFFPSWFFRSSSRRRVTHIAEVCHRSRSLPLCSEGTQD